MPRYVPATFMDIFISCFRETFPMEEEDVTDGMLMRYIDRGTPDYPTEEETEYIVTEGNLEDEEFCLLSYLEWNPTIIDFTEYGLDNLYELYQMRKPRRAY